MKIALNHPAKLPVGRIITFPAHGVSRLWLAFQNMNSREAFERMIGTVNTVGVPKRTGSLRPAGRLDSSSGMFGLLATLEETRAGPLWMHQNKKAAPSSRDRSA